MILMNDPPLRPRDGVAQALSYYLEIRSTFTFKFHALHQLETGYPPTS